MAGDASELARRLSCEAEAVCRHYLSNGRRAGRYWLVGDVYNTPGRSMFVRLQDSTKGSAGKWTDAATGEHGDLLDIIRERTGISRFPDLLAEARAHLGLVRRCRRGGEALSEAASFRGAITPEARSSSRAGRIAGSRSSALCDIQPD